MDGGLVEPASAARRQGRDPMVQATFGVFAGIGNGLILGWLMYRSGLVPRPMALLGLVVVLMASCVSFDTRAGEEALNPLPPLRVAVRPQSPVGRQAGRDLDPTINAEAHERDATGDKPRRHRYNSFDEVVPDGDPV